MTEEEKKKIAEEAAEQVVEDTVQTAETAEGVEETAEVDEEIAQPVEEEAAEEVEEIAAEEIVETPEEEAEEIVEDEVQAEEVEETAEVKDLKEKLTAAQKALEQLDLILKNEFEAKLSAVTDEKKRKFLEDKGGSYSEKLSFYSELEEAGFLESAAVVKERPEIEIGRNFKAELKAHDDSEDFDGRKSLYQLFRKPIK